MAVCLLAGPANIIIKRPKYTARDRRLWKIGSVVKNLARTFANKVTATRSATGTKPYKMESKGFFGDTKFGKGSLAQVS